MNRNHKISKHTCKCINCGYVIGITRSSIKEQKFGDITATYLECPVCGERMLQQLDNDKTLAQATKAVKLRTQIRKQYKLSSKQKKTLKTVENSLYLDRLFLNTHYWDEIYQSLNEEKTGDADHGHDSGYKVTNTDEVGRKE